MHVLPLLHSWKSQRGKKRGRGPKSEDDDGFEVVPIEDPGESSALSGREGHRRGGCCGLSSDLLLPSLVKHRIRDPEGLALGAVIASSKKAKRDLIDDSFSR